MQWTENKFESLNSNYRYLRRGSDENDSSRPRFYNRKSFPQSKRHAIKHPAVPPIARLGVQIQVQIQVQGLHFAYPEHKLFTDFSVQIGLGVTLIQGGDGRGKTTLLRLLAGELTADAGTLHIHQLDLQKQPAAYRQQLFWTDARSEAFDQLTPPEYFEMQRKRWPGFDNQSLAELIRGLDLEVHLHKKLFMLSTGSKRKVWLAAAFASGAAVTLLDEPFAALDTPSIRFVIQRLKGAAARPERAYVIADYEAPADVPLAAVIDLGG